MLDFFNTLKPGKEIEDRNLRHVSLPESSLILRDPATTENEELNLFCDEIVSSDGQNCFHIELLSHVDQESIFQDFCTITLQQNVPDHKETGNVLAEMSVHELPQANSKTSRSLPPENLLHHSSEPPVCPMKKAVALHFPERLKETQVYLIQVFAVTQ